MNGIKGRCTGWDGRSAIGRSNDASASADSTYSSLQDHHSSFFYNPECCSNLDLLPAASPEQSTMVMTMMSTGSTTSSGTLNKNTSTTTTRMNNTSLVMLSAVWLTLCASLVHKHLELIAVFFAFVGSFLLAALLTTVKTYSSTISVSVSVASVPTGTGTTTGSKAAMNVNSNSNSNSNSRTRNLVGLVACTVAFMVLSGSALTPTSWTTQTGPEYSALSIAAGYLAFDHWFSAMYCQQQQLWQVTEDALTLTVLLIVLANLGDGLGDYRTSTCAWVAYKTIRLAWQLDTDMDTPNKIMSTSVMGSPQSTTESESAPEVDMNNNDVKNSNDVNSTWIIHGETYHLQDYVTRHPGGLEAIMLGRGRDCTALFESYHPFTNQHKLVLQKYKDSGAIQQQKLSSKKMVTGKRTPTPTTPIPQDYFYEVLCQRVAQTLKQKGIDPIADRCATPLRTLYYGLVLLAVVASGISHVKGSIIGSFLFAVFGWLIGAMGHDAGHFAASRYPVVNDWALWGMSLLCNPIMWQHQHTYAHHSNTNEFDHDPDLHHFHTFLRAHRRFQQQSIYKHQSNLLYVIFAYTFVVFGTCLWIPLGMVREGTLYGCVEWSDRKRPWRAVGMYGHMMVYVWIIMMVPFCTHASWPRALAAVVLHVATSGLIFAFFSQINHLNEPSLDTEERKRQQESREDSRLVNSWAVDQIETSNNFAPGSTLWHVLSNGLNYQIEHHLFPGLNHCHLHHISPVVRSTCEEYGVCYKSYETWSDVMQATLDWLDKLSIESELEPEKTVTKVQ